MDHKDRVRFSDSLVLRQQVKTRSVGYLSHGGEGIGGMPYMDGRRRGSSSGRKMFSVDSEKKGGEKMEEAGVMPM